MRRTGTPRRKRTDGHGTAAVALAAVGVVAALLGTVLAAAHPVAAVTVAVAALVVREAYRRRPTDRTETRRPRLAREARADPR